MPISTMLKDLSSRSSERASSRTCPAISAALRWRSSPILPVRQNAQPIAQPTCVETQNVCFGVSGMKTDSICLPSARRSTNFCVPSSETSCWITSGSETIAFSASAARSSRLRFVIASKSVTPRFQIQW